MEGIRGKDKMSNLEVLRRPGEEREVLKILKRETAGTYAEMGFS